MSFQILRLQSERRKKKVPSVKSERCSTKGRKTQMESDYVTREKFINNIKRVELKMKNTMEGYKTVKNATNSNCLW